MKTSFSIAFTLILLLNVMGYYGLFLGMQYRNDVAMTKAFDADMYSEPQMVTIKVPISMPYAGDDIDFKRVDGKLEHLGETYRLMKQKYAHDTLTVICVKDVENKRINQALVNYVKTFADKTSDQNQNSKVCINFFIKDYLPQTISLKSITLGWESEIFKQSFNQNLNSSFIVSVIHPPERICLLTTTL